MRQKKKITIGTRGSALALAQTKLVCRQLLKVAPDLKNHLSIKIISTTGDQILDRPLREIGGKQLFIKEIEQALLRKDIDFAVHSAKDIETHLAEELMLAACLEREDHRDVLISYGGQAFNELRDGATVGTVSLRRITQLKHLRPDLTPVFLRGNITTRLGKLSPGTMDAIILAYAGLKRLKINHKIATVFCIDDFVPAVGQGIIAIECRQEDTLIRDLISAINHAPTMTLLKAERAMLVTLNGTCNTPIGGLAQREGASEECLKLTGMIADPEGHSLFKVSLIGAINQPEEVGRRVAEELIRRAGAHFIESLR